MIQHELLKLYRVTRIELYRGASTEMSEGAEIQTQSRLCTVLA